MNAADVVGYVTDGGEVICADCGDASDDSLFAIFCDHEDEYAGATCADCGCVLVDGDWLLSKDATNPEYTRWAHCTQCRGQRPHSKNDWNYKARRVDALLHRYFCGCGGEYRF